MTQANSAHDKRYVDTRAGQVFCRCLGAGRPLLLVHWTPLSSRMYRHIMPLLAAQGFACIAPDLPGYGRSDPRPERWSMPEYAGVMLEVLDTLGHAQACVLGGHNGSSVAAEMARQAPERTTAVVLDGVPLLTPELRAAFARLSTAARPATRADGSHATQGFDTAVALLREYIPGFEVSDETLPLVYETLIDYLETDFVSSGPIAGAYDLAEALPELTRPVLLLGAERDSLAGNFAGATALLTSPRTHLFAGHHPIHFPSRAAEYVEVIADFLNTPD
ncbi:MAG: alpha/beta fold hydrolase [Gammaproteobacteria bacterium]|nr:alpha/beta fold hydrolase [Gammaproteobacteria bacterium]TVQ47930.1 MAG: alpha/beta fold hydrolase [Gammaproteobacteria bacterium]